MFEWVIKLGESKRFYIFDMDGTLCDSMSYWRRESVFVKDFRNRVQVEPVFERMREHYRCHIELKDGVTEFLKNAKERGIGMCIASATRRDVAEPFLERSGLMEYMEFYIDCFDVHAFKERPDVYFRAAERLGAEMSECVVFEDAEYCARTAKQAGFFVVGIYDETADREGDPKRFCDLFFERWSDVVIDVGDGK